MKKNEKHTPKYLLFEYSNYLNRTVSTNDTKCDIFSYYSSVFLFVCLYVFFCIVPSWMVVTKLLA